MWKNNLPAEGKKLADMSVMELARVVRTAWEIEDEYEDEADPIHVECDDISVSALCKMRRMTAILQLKLCLMYGVPTGAERTRFMFELPKTLLEPDKELRDSFYLWDSASDFMADIHSFADFSGIGGFSCEYVDIDEISDIAELCLDSGLMAENGELLNTESDYEDLVPCLTEAMRDYFDYPDRILSLFVEGYLNMTHEDVLRYNEFIVVSSSDVPKVLSVMEEIESVQLSAEAVLYGRCLEMLRRSSIYTYQSAPVADEYNGKWFAANLTMMEYMETGEFEQGLGLALSNRITAAVAGVLAERILAQAKEEPKKWRNSRRARNV